MGCRCLAAKCSACGVLGTFSPWGDFRLCDECGHNLRKNRIMLLEECGGRGKKVRVLCWEEGKKPWETHLSWSKFLDALEGKGLKEEK